MRAPADESRTLTAETIVVNLGARPASPDLPGLAGVPWLDSTSIMELDAVPEHLVVVGGGVIGLEFAQMFHRFGSRVTLLQRDAQLLPQEDPDIADAVRAILEDEGVTVRLGTHPASVDPHGSGLQVTSADGSLVSGSHLLLAAGRVPNTDGLRPSAAGLEMDARGYLVVNDRLETNVPGIYAAGDVKGGPAFTHIAYDDYRMLRDHLIEGAAPTTIGRAVPYCVYIDPQFGRIGLNEREARRRGVTYRLATMPMAHVARALEANESRGVMKVLIDPADDLILGASILGMEGGEVMSILQVAMMGRLPYPTLRETTFVHPSLAESLNNLFGTIQEP